MDPEFGVVEFGLSSSFVQERNRVTVHIRRITNGILAVVSPMKVKKVLGSLHTVFMIVRFLILINTAKMAFRKRAIVPNYNLKRIGSYGMGLHPRPRRETFDFLEIRIENAF
jgi:hypothetical protein